MSSKWDFLLESKPKELQQHLLDEVAKLLAKDLEAFPPPVQEWADSTEGQRLQALFANELSRPTPALYRMAFQLARWELQREHEAMAEFIRNERYREEAPEAHAKQVLLFLERWLTEQLYELNEAVEGRLSRKQLISCLDDAERRLLGPRS